LDVGSVDRGSFNEWEIVVGIPGTGKTTYAVALAEQKAARGYVFAHTAGTFPRKMPGGRKPRVREWESVAACRAGLARGECRGVINLIAGDASAVIAFGLEVARKSMEQGGGERSIPVTIFIDEVVAAAELNPYRIDDEVRQLVALRRHMNVGFLATTQSPQLCHYQIMALATKLHLFRVTHRAALKRLEDIGVPASTTAIVARLSKDRHERVEWGVS
jgi:hypothetical protein